MKPSVREFKNSVLIILGILSAGLGLKGFLLSSHFIDGGVTGVPMLLAEVFGLHLLGSRFLPWHRISFVFDTDLLRGVTND